MVSSFYRFERFERRLITGKTLLVIPKFGTVEDPPPIDHPRRMLQMEHLVVEDKFDQLFRNLRIVEGSTDDDRIVHIIVMAEDTLRSPLTPAKIRLGKRVSKIAAVETPEDLIQVIDSATTP